MISVEIYERKTGKVLETKSFQNDRQLRSFAFYWAMQCDSKRYGYRQIENKEVQ